MKPLEPISPVTQTGANFERKAVPLPPGTIQYDGDMSRIGKTLEEQRSLEGTASFGVISLKEVLLTKDEMMNFIPQKSWDTISPDGIPVTKIFLGGMGTKRKVIV